MKKTANRHLSDSLKQTLDRIKKSNLSKVEGDAHGIAPDTMAGLIATGRITRERACDGKKRYRTYEFTEEVRGHLQAKYGKHYESYACAFCSGFHLATREEDAA